MSDVTTWDADKKARFATEILGEANLTPQQISLIQGSMDQAPYKEVLKKLSEGAAGTSAIPTLMASPPTCALSAANAATSIASSVRFRMDTPGYFRYLGVEKPILNNDSFTSTGKYSLTTDTPWAAEFIFETTDSTGRFEVIMTGKNAGMRILVNGQYATATPTFKPAADGNVYLGLVTLGAAGLYRIKVEMDGTGFFRGINAGPTDTVRATAKKRLKIGFAGDSFTEPTVIDNAITTCGWDGYVQKLSYILDADCISCGSGGTGYINTGTPGAGRVKMLDRIADLINLNADIYVFALGINDYANVPADIGVQALACFNAVRAAYPDVPIIVTSPWFKAGFFTYPAGLLAASDAIKDAAVQVAGTIWIDVLTTFVEPITLPSAGVLSSGASAGATTISSSVSIPLNIYFKIGDHLGTNQEVRRSTSVTGTGPYTIGFNGTSFTGGGSVLLNAHFAGEAITPCGPGIYSGNGRQGSAQSNGNADRYTGTDNTHPTPPGHRNIADCWWRETRRVINAL